MGIMVSQVYDAFVEAGVSETKARAAAESILVSELATKQDISMLETKMWKTGIAIASLVATVLSMLIPWLVSQIGQSLPDILR